MTSIGTGYDLSNSVFSPDGRNFQVEYAVKAVENGGTAIGIRCTDGVVLACEKIVTSKLLVPGSNKRIAHVDRHVGIASSGLVPDGRHFVNRAREESIQWRKLYKEPIPLTAVAERMGGYAQAYTLYSSVRPFGITAIIAGGDADGPGLYMVEPSGLYWGYFGAATGKGRQVAKSEIEKLPLSTLSINEAVKEAARIIHLAHDDNKDKDFELEMTWVREDQNSGATKGMIGNGWVHEEVPKTLVDEADTAARKLIEGDDEEEKEENAEADTTTTAPTAEPMEED